MAHAPGEIPVVGGDANVLLAEHALMPTGTGAAARRIDDRAESAEFVEQPELLGFTRDDIRCRRYDQANAVRHLVAAQNLQRLLKIDKAPIGAGADANLGDADAFQLGDRHDVVRAMRL